MDAINRLWSSVGSAGTVETADIVRNRISARFDNTTTFTRTHSGSMSRKWLNLALPAALLMLLSARADAGITTWDLSNVFFDDGTQATGSLTFDSVGSFVFDLSTWDVTVAQGVGGDIVFPLYTFNPGDSDFTFTNAANLMDPEVLLFNHIFDNRFTIVLAGFTLPASGILDLATRASPFVDGSGFRYSSSETLSPTVLFTYQRFVVSGSLVLESTVAPEPSTWMLAGGVLLALAARKRKRPPKSSVSGS